MNASRQNAYARSVSLSILGQRVRTARKGLGMTQQELAARRGVAAETLSRWENGTQVQQRAYDRFLRIFFGFADVRAVLADEARLVGL